MNSATLPRQRLILLGVGASLLSVLLLYLLFGSHLTTFQDGLSSKLGSFSHRGKESRLHLIVPVTSPAFRLCQTLLSMVSLGWPAPIFIGWNIKPADGNAGGKVSHLFKVTSTLAYLQKLPEEQDDDLVLLVDAYDIWFQLRPEVFLARYFAVKEDANRRIAAELGRATVERYGLKNTVLFNVDKGVWPPIDVATDLWWLPKPDIDFGPYTDIRDLNDNIPRWVNSGSIIGPVKDVRRVFDAARKRIQRDFSSTHPEWRGADQGYFSSVFADQEYARYQLRPNSSQIQEHPFKSAFITPGQETDYGMFLDYFSDLTQTLALNEDFLGWLSFEKPREPAPDQTRLAAHQIDLTSDILSSRPPFAGIAAALDINNTHVDENIEKLVTSSTWRNISLSTNLATGRVYPILHLTGLKEHLDDYWSRMWFVKYGPALLTSALAVRTDDFIYKAKDGRIFRAGDGTPDSRPRQANETVGAYTDAGQWLSWDGHHGICEPWQDWVFNKKTLPPPPEVHASPPKEPVGKALVTTLVDAQGTLHTTSAKSKPKPTPSSSKAPE
jgi:hypothetical protein